MLMKIGLKNNFIISTNILNLEEKTRLHMGLWEIKLHLSIFYTTMRATFNKAHFLKQCPCRVDPYLVIILNIGKLSDIGRYQEYCVHGHK